MTNCDGKLFTFRFVSSSVYFNCVCLSSTKAVYSRSFARTAYFFYFFFCGEPLLNIASPLRSPIVSSFVHFSEV